MKKAVKQQVGNHDGSVEEVEEEVKKKEEE